MRRYMVFPAAASACLIVCCILAASSSRSCATPSPVHDDQDPPYLVAHNNAGVADQQPFLAAGEAYLYPKRDVALSVAGENDPARSVAFGETVTFLFQGLDPAARYTLHTTYLSDGPRVQTVAVGGFVLDKVALQASSVVHSTIALPPACYPDGSLVVTFKRIEGPNAVVSVVDLLSDRNRPLHRLELRLRAGLHEGIEGDLQDRAGRMATGGATIQLRVRPDPEASGPPPLPRTVKVKTAPDGRFTAPLPGSWRRTEGATLETHVTGPDFELHQERPLATILATRLPRFTPIPASIGGRELPDRGHGEDPVSISLDGAWAFQARPRERFFETPAATDPESWNSIEVPGQWVEQGFEVASDQAAAYRRAITIPGAWRGRRMKLRFDAVFSDATVWVDGLRAGRHEGGFTPFEIDVTDQVAPGRTHTLALAVKSDSPADVLASASQYAAHPLGGITRKVTLFSVPPVNVAALDVETRFDEMYENALLHLDVTIANQARATAGKLSLACRVEAPGTPARCIAEHAFSLPAVRGGEEKRTTFEMAVAHPAKWDCEHPVLHRLIATLRDETDIIEVIEKRFGFRQVEVRGNRLIVNGVPVKLRGINRHETHPLRGRSLTPELWRLDAELFRAANVNMIRTSHYPPAEEFIDACDELGLFVEEEAPLCWVGHPANEAWADQNAANDRYFARLAAANLEMIQRDRSHPSILYWSLANESRWTENFERVHELVDAADPSRPESFHDQAWGSFNNAGSKLDIANIHYPGPGGPERAASVGRPVLFGEYCHLNTYNRAELATDPGVRETWGEGLAAMWEKMYATDAVLGGDIWAGIDDLFVLGDGREVGYGEWGPLDGWRRPKPEYWHIKKVYSPVRVLSRGLAPVRAGETVAIELENRHDFTDLEEIKIDWRSGSSHGTAHVQAGPHQRGTLIFRPDRTLPDGGELELSFASPRGFLIDTVRLPIGREKAQSPPPSPTPGVLQMSKDDRQIVVDGGRARWVIDRHTGHLIRASVGTETILLGGPTLMILPLRGGPCRPDYRPDVKPFNETCTGWQAGRVTALRQDDGTVIIEVSGTTDQADLDMRLSFRGNGLLAIDYRLVSRIDVNPRQIGLVFDLPRSLDRLTWRRHGRWSVYPEDHIGRNSGLALPFYEGVRSGWGRIPSPTWPWGHDANALGSNDFRATRTHILRAGLQDAGGLGFRVHSTARHAIRAWVDGTRVRFLVAGHDAGGGEPFFSSHLADRRREMKPGSVFEDTVSLEVGQW